MRSLSFLCVSPGQPTIAQPLLISNPNDGFCPADPWFDSLDPSRQGLAFTRRYGFDMDAMSDIPPDNRQLWIRKLSGSPALGIYDYNASTTPKKWTPIFGTAGTSNATSTCEKAV